MTSISSATVAGAGSPAPASNLTRFSSSPAAALRRQLIERLVRAILFFCGCVSIITTAAIIVVLLVESVGFFEQVGLIEFLTGTVWTPLFAEKSFGILPLVSGTVLTSLIALSFALPVGLLIAIYLSEFAPNALRRVVKPILEILAGIPTIVYGYFALLFVTPLLQAIFPEMSGFNALSAGLVMGVMILPMVASLSEDAFFAVPNSLREASYALGATRLQMVFKTALPAALGGVTAAFILAMSRAVGETMIVTIAAGQQANLTLNPLSAAQTMTAYIVQISMGDVPHGTLEYRTIFAVGALLFLMTLSLNFISIRIRERFKRSLG